MKRKHERITVLFAEEAETFGGSIVVIGYLVDAMDESRFRKIVTAEMDPDVLNHVISDKAATYIVPHRYNYVQWGRTVDSINRLRVGFFIKIATYTMSIVRSIANIPYFVRLVWVIFKEEVDIVHVNNGMTNVEAILAALFTRSKIIVHLHQIKEPGLFQRILIKKVSRFIAISEYIKNEMLRFYVPDNRTVVIHNPVKQKSISSFSTNDIRADYGIKNDDLVFGIVGRIVRWKGHIEFLRAAKFILDEVPGSKAIIVGDFSDGNSSYQDMVISIVKKAGLEDRVILTGYVKEIEKIYSIMDVFIHASIGPEPFGLVITEAMSYGIPVIASDRGAPQEIITDGRNGYLVNPEDTNKLVAVIKRLLQDEKLRSRIGMEGKEHVMNNYQVNDYATAVSKVYFDVLGLSEPKKLY